MVGQRVRSVVVAVAAVAAVVVPLGVTAPAAQGVGTVQAAVSLSAPASGVYGSSITLRGRLWRYGTAYGLNGAVVWLQRTPHGRAAWANLTNTRTGTNGVFAFSVTQTGAYDYRAYYAGSATFTRAWSPARYPVTNRNVLLDSIATGNYETGLLRAAGRVLPAPPNDTTVVLQRWDTSARMWVALTSGRTSSGRVSFAATRPGSVTSYRMVVGAFYPYGAGVSATRSFAHYVWRGAFTKPLIQVKSSANTDVRPRTPSEDPSRSTAEIFLGQAGWVDVAPDIAGCVLARSWTGNLYSSNDNIEIAYYVNYQPQPGGTLGQGAGELYLGIGLTGVSRLSYYAYRGDANFFIYARVRLLCNN